MNLQNARILITGGSTGIGYETAKQLTAKGAKVILCARNENDVKKAAAEAGAIGLVADVSNEASVAALFEKVQQELGGLDVLINNAGIGLIKPLVETSADEFTQVWETNVRGAFYMGREAAKIFLSQNSGNIVNIASTAGSRGFAGGSAYCSSKFALSGLTESWRAELRKHNVRVMQVNPSEVITPFATKLGHEPQNTDSKLKPTEIAHTIVAMLELNDVGFITDATVWATNPQ